MTGTATKYDDLSRETLLAILLRQESQRKFGLVWERPPSEVEQAINDDFVALDLIPELCSGSAPYDNLIVEGDNFDALRALRATHAGKIKVILIDPPYNTGKRDFVYNDRYVDSEHKFRHSVWVEFMYRRLTLARDLLREDGVIFVNIGEDEFAHLSMLMDQVFPGMKVGSLVWRTREGGNDAQRDGPFFSQDHEYVVCYAGPRFRFGGQEKNQSHYDNPDSDPRGPWFASDLTTPKTIAQVPKSYFPIVNPATGIYYPANPDRVWGNAAEKNLRPGQKLKAPTIEALIADGRMIFPEGETPVTYSTRAELDAAIVEGSAPRVLRAGLPGLDDLVGKPIGFGRPKLKRFQREGRTQTKPLSSWILAASASPAERAIVPADANVIVSSTSREATQTVNRILGEKLFSYPKPVSLYRALLEQSTSVEDGDIVLDFFAGSGTTAQAVLELNRGDGGNRRFILVSSTEATEEDPSKNICRDVCRERVARVISGYESQARGRGKAKKVDGIDGKFAYLRAVRLPLETVSAKLQHQWVWTALQLLHADRIGSLMPKKELKVMSLEDSDVVYVPEITDGVVEQLRTLFTRRASATIYSWRPGVLRQEFGLEGVSFEKIPDNLIARFGGRR